MTLQAADINLALLNYYYRVKKLVQHNVMGEMDMFSYNIGVLTAAITLRNELCA